MNASTTTLNPAPSSARRGSLPRGNRSNGSTPMRSSPVAASATGGHPLSEGPTLLGQGCTTCEIFKFHRLADQPMARQETGVEADIHQPLDIGSPAQNHEAGIAAEESGQCRGRPRHRAFVAGNAGPGAHDHDGTAGDCRAATQDDPPGSAVMPVVLADRLRRKASTEHRQASYPGRSSTRPGASRSKPTTEPPLHTEDRGSIREPIGGQQRRDDRAPPPPGLMTITGTPR